MRNVKWNIWTILLAIALGIIALRIVAAIFSWLWVLGSFVLGVLLWVAVALVLAYGIRYLYLKLRGR